MKKKLILFNSIALLAFGILGILGFSAVKAQESLEDYPLIVQNLVERFGLNADEVEKVFEDTRTQRHSERFDEYTEDGTITEEQKNFILEKMEETREKLDAIHIEEMTTDERQEAMQNIHEELSNWAEENNIPEEVMIFGVGKGPRNRNGMGPGIGIETENFGGPHGGWLAQ